MKLPAGAQDRYYPDFQESSVITSRLSICNRVYVIIVAVKSAGERGYDHKIGEINVFFTHAMVLVRLERHYLVFKPCTRTRHSRMCVNSWEANFC